ncbi:MAG TPA: hypothetical protein VEJ63_01670 [Planctomycetota bacterium]|nr:hypothetical protein [Planctomycetota bacterium]
MNQNLRTPKWQDLTGLDPELEADMDRDDRREAIRVLFREVERLARQEFDFARDNPSDERTFLWDPLDYICNVLEISRVKLSSYMRELTGMRAHEVTDRIKAADLPAKLRARLEKQFAALLPALEAIASPLHLREGVGGGVGEGDAFDRAFEFARERVREERKGPNAMRWAVELGYANPSRVHRACVLAHTTTIQALEEEILRTLVQKFSRRSSKR